jgi:hypothetical protein
MSALKRVSVSFAAVAFTAAALAQRPTDGVNNPVLPGSSGSNLTLALVACAICLGVGVVIGYLIGKATNK